MVEGYRVTVTEAAARLRLDKSVVSRQVARFGIKDEAGKFDFEQFVALRNSELNPLMRRTPGGDEGHALDEALEVDADAPADSAPPAPDQPTAASPAPMTGLAKANAERTTAQTRLLQLEIDEREGRLIERAGVEEAQTTVARIVRDNLLTIPARASLEVAGVSDPAQARAIIERHIVEALEQLTRQLAELGGVELDQAEVAA